MKDFLVKYAVDIKNYLELSHGPGARADYVQGGGGNTSVKFDNGLMAIKASGFKLSQIQKDNGYAVLDYRKIRDFYMSNQPDDFEDIEASGSAVAKENVVEVEGIPVLRPSVEAGFHSIMDKFVLHTHPVYANMAACSKEGLDIIARVLKDKDYEFAYVNYINPGVNLTFSIRDEMDKVQERTGKRPAVIFMQNHGFIVTHDDYKTCVAIHDEVNELMASAFGVGISDFPEIKLIELSLSDEDSNSSADKLYISETGWVKEQVKVKEHDIAYFCDKSLYPDQMVFLQGNLTILDGPLPEDKSKWAQNKCTIYKGSGDVVYNCGFDQAQTIEETLAAVTFITVNIQKSGYEVITMDEAGKDFIANWESEKYRKSLLTDK